MNKSMKIALLAFAIVAVGQVVAMNQYSPVEDELLVKTHEKKMQVDRQYRRLWNEPIMHYNREMSRVYNAQRRLAAYKAGEIVPVEEVEVENATMPQTHPTTSRPTMPQSQSNWRPNMPQTPPTTSIPNMSQQTPLLGLPGIQRPQVPVDEPAFVPAPQEQPAAEPAQAPEKPNLRANPSGLTPRLVLGVPNTATKKEAIKAFRQLSPRYHPDQYLTYRVELMQEGINTPQEAQDVFTKINAAYQVIKDEKE